MFQCLDPLCIIIVADMSETAPAGRQRYACNFVSRCDPSGWLHRIHIPRMLASATALLCELEQPRDFAHAIAARASNIFGPISRHRITQVLPAVRKATRATRPGMVVGAIRVLCHGVCTSHRFHTEFDDRDQFVDRDVMMNPIAHDITTIAPTIAHVFSCIRFGSCRNLFLEMWPIPILQRRDLCSSRVEMVARAHDSLSCRARVECVFFINWWRLRHTFIALSGLMRYYFVAVVSCSHRDPRIRHMKS